MNPFKFQDIVNLPYPNSEIEKDFPDEVLNAAQFAPFSALTGHGDAVEETARLTESKIILDESQKEELNRTLGFLKQVLSQIPKITVTYFVADSRKEGGKYAVTEGNLKKISEQNGYILLQDGTKIMLKDICNLESDAFPSTE